ncbi:MAG: thiamine pyrophosphate-dependent enzyme, partial [Actinomycetes bacterium]
IDQVRLFGGSVRFFVDLSVDDVPGTAGWRSVVAEGLAATATGPVHLNVALREPLVPDSVDSRAEPLGSTVEPPDPRPVPLPATPVEVARGPRTVVVAGDGAGPGARGLAEANGWPLLAEPTSGARSGPNALAAYRFLLAHLGADIERVVVAGRPTLSRPVTRLLARRDLEVVGVPAGRSVPTGEPAEPDVWLTGWLDADASARAAMAEVLADGPLSGPGAARVVAAATGAGALLVAGSSSAVRDLDLADPWPADATVLANRGASGIDGTVSTAVGAALAHGGPAVALVGDLTFLHDVTGLVIGPDEPRPDLTVVVNNDDGGGLFALLEQGAPEHADSFERLFGTPHGVDLAAVCAATHTAYELVATGDELAAALSPATGVGVVEVRTDRTASRDLHDRLRSAVAAALQV